MLPGVFLLSSFTTGDFYSFFSHISRTNLIVLNTLKEYSSVSISTLSNVKQDIVSTLTLNYEVLQMYKGTEVISTYHPGYVFLYQADIYINNSVEYKGGLFNWFDGCHAGFLDSLSIGLTFNGTGQISHAYQTPSLPSRDFNDNPRFLRGVFPTDNLYQQDSYYYDKQTEHNMIGLYPRFNDLDLFTDAINIVSNSYFDSVYEAVFNYSEYIGQYDSRLIANVNTTETRYNNSITFSQIFSYNNQVTFTFNGTSSTPTIQIYNDPDHLYSGPCTNGIDDNAPFNFTFYGAFCVECANQPNSATLSLNMHSYHGSHTALDIFDSSASTQRNINF